MLVLLTYLFSYDTTQDSGCYMLQIFKILHQFIYYQQHDVTDVASLGFVEMFSRHSQFKSASWVVFTSLKLCFGFVTIREQL